MEKEYLANIRKFSKQNNIEENLKVNDLVLVLTEKINKFDWPIGRVSNVHKGRDGNVRTVEIKMPIKAHQSIRSSRRINFKSFVWREDFNTPHQKNSNRKSWILK